MTVARVSVTALALVLFATASASAIYVVGKKGSKERADDCYMQADICYRGCEGVTEENKCFGDCQSLYDACMAAPNPKAAAGGNSPVGPSGSVLEQAPAAPAPSVFQQVPGLKIVPGN